MGDLNIHNAGKQQELLTLKDLTEIRGLWPEDAMWNGCFFQMGPLEHRVALRGVASPCKWLLHWPHFPCIPVPCMRFPVPIGCNLEVSGTVCSEVGALQTECSRALIFGKEAKSFALAFGLCCLGRTTLWSAGCTLGLRGWCCLHESHA